MTKVIKNKKARWEFPAGHLDGKDTPLEAAIREWEEETNAKFPKNAKQIGTWVSEDGKFQGFVYQVKSEAEIELGTVNGHEISAAAWWDVDDLDDPKMRDKVKESLDRIEPLIEQATKSEFTHSDFHRTTDEIIARMTPLIQKGMDKVLDWAEVEKIIDQALTAPVSKATSPTSSTNPLATPATPIISPLPAQAAIVGGAAAALTTTATGTVAALGAATSAAASVSGLLALLLAARGNFSPIRIALRRLYLKAYDQGVTESARASNNLTYPQDSTLDVNPPRGLQSIFANIESIIDEITTTQCKRIASAIIKGIKEGKSRSEIIATVKSIMDDKERANFIAETEFSRARTKAARETYRLNNVQMVAWLHQPNACGTCMENAAVSPISIQDSWPAGGAPVHPACRCVEVPFTKKVESK